MKVVDIKVGQLVDYPIEISAEGNVIFNELLTRNRHIADLTTLVGARGEEKIKIKERSVKGVKLSSYEIQENDIILRARRTSYGLFMFGFRVNKIHKNLKLCSTEAFFVMYDGHFDDGYEIQYTLFGPVLNLIERVQRFQFMV